MSNSFYNNIWYSMQEDIESLAIADYDGQNQVHEQESIDKKSLQSSTYEFYIRYICIANKLEEIYDKLIPPQKRLYVRKLLEACLGRIIELKFDLVSIDMVEFSYNDEVMERLRLTPEDTELRIPRYFRRERQGEIEARQNAVDEILIKLGWIEENTNEEKLTELEAIKLIQIHERARQGRLRAHFMKEIRMFKEKGKFENSRDRNESGLQAAMKIQKMWRGHVARKKTRRRKMEEMVLIRMIPDTSAKTQKKFSETIMCTNQIIEERYKAQEREKKLYEDELRRAKEEVKGKHAANISENIADEIRAWIKDYYDKTKKLPYFPSEENGGSRHIFSRPGTESELSRSSARSSKESRRTKEKLKSPIRSGDLNVCETVNDDGIIFQQSQSVFFTDVKAGIEELNDVFNKNKVEDEQSSHDIMYSEVLSELEEQIRKAIDEMMRQELDTLQTALGKKNKKGNKKARRSGKKNKKKKEKDLTPDRTTESLFEELVTNGIIRKYPPIKLDQYLGDKSYAARNGMNPTSGDIRQILIEYCILPLGSEVIRNSSPCIRSLLIAGPKGTGKKMLLHAICNEIGAVLFDLTPANIVGKYPGKSGLIMLIHLVLKVSRLLQPSVIYMGDAERPFMKKIPKTDRNDPKRLKKDLAKLVKNIAVEDRVILIGLSNAPWDADQKLLQQTYNRFICIPRPDFGMLSTAWKQLITKYTSGISSFDCGNMAKITDGYTIGDVDISIRNVITCRRRLQLRTQPLTHTELINEISKRDPVYREEEEAFEAWWLKTPLGRRRQRALEILEENQCDEQNI